MIGINEAHIVKVWIRRLLGELGVAMIHNVRQEDMVRTIIQSVEAAADLSKGCPQEPSIMSYLYRDTQKLNFEEAIGRLNYYSRCYYDGAVPKAMVRSINHLPIGRDVEHYQKTI